MTKDWNRFKSQIEVLYIRERRSLKEVRHHMHKQHDFFASTRAYRIKLDAWGFRKNRKLRDGTSTPPKSPTAIVVIGTPSSLEAHRESASPTPGLASTLTSPVHHDDENIPRGQASLVLHRGPWGSSWSPNVWPSTEVSNMETTLDFDDSAANSLLNLSRDHPQEVPSLSIGNGYVNNWDKLNEAIQKRHLTVVQEILGSSEARGIRSEDFHDLLVSVIQNEIEEPQEASCDIVKLLLQCGASPVSSGDFGMTPLHIAVRSSCILETLLESIVAFTSDLPGVDPVNSNGNTPLLSLLTPFATSRSDPNEIDIKPRIELLLKAGANPNHKSDVGFTAFRLALTIQQRAPFRDVVNFALFIQKGADVLCPMTSGESPLKIFLNTTYWYEQDEMQWAQVILLFLDHGADANTLIGEDTLLSFGIRKLLFDSKCNSQRDSAILKVMRRACDLVELESWMFGQMRKLLHLLIRILCCTPEEASDTLIACIRTLVDRWAAKRLTEEVSVLFTFTMMVISPSQIEASNIIRILEIFLNAGANPLRQDESADRPIYVALRQFSGDLQCELIRLLLERSITAQEDGMDSHPLRDSSWFKGWKIACRSRSWILSYEDGVLPLDLTSQQRNVLVKTARNILADTCIINASDMYFRSTSESNRQSAKQQILDIIYSTPYKELEGIRVSSVKDLLKMMLENDNQCGADGSRIASDEIETLLSNACTCGDSCQCFGCLTHPNNSTARTHMQHLEHIIAADENIGYIEGGRSRDSSRARSRDLTLASSSVVERTSSPSGAVAPVSPSMSAEASEIPRTPRNDGTPAFAFRGNRQSAESPSASGNPLDDLLTHVSVMNDASRGFSHTSWMCLEKSC